MLILVLNIVLFGLVATITAYLIRHYVFAFATLYCKKEPRSAQIMLKYDPMVSVLVPAHNEERVIGRILQRMTELTYPKEKFEVIVIDDGSTDRTGEIAKKFANDYCYIRLIQRGQQDGGRGKPEALNCALKQLSGEIIYCFDADYYPRLDIMERLTVCFEDPKVGAVQGRVTVLNEKSSIVTRLVALERTGGYRVDQFARNELGLISQFGGTVGGVRKTLLETFDGWDADMLAEDTDITFKVYLAGYKVEYVNDADCYEEAVEKWSQYWNQRSRWAKGHMQCAFRYVWSVLRSKNLCLREKVDGVLLLNVYFVPVLATVAWVLGTILFFLQSMGDWIGFLWVVVPISFYSAVGNFAPFFEVGVGVYLDGRGRICWLLPLLLLTFSFNVLICTKAFVDLCFSKLTGKKRLAWSKTVHVGDGAHHI